MTIKELNLKITVLKVNLKHALHANDFEDFDAIAKEIDELEALLK